MSSTMRPHDIYEDYVTMKAFPVSLDGVAKNWLYLQPNPINIWTNMKRRFLEKFFRASRTTSIQKEICGIRHQPRKTL